MIKMHLHAAVKEKEKEKLNLRDQCSKVIRLMEDNAVLKRKVEEQTREFGSKNPPEGSAAPPPSFEDSSIDFYYSKELYKAANSEIEEIAGCLSVLHVCAWDRLPKLAPPRPPPHDPQAAIYQPLPPLAARGSLQQRCLRPRLTKELRNLVRLCATTQLCLVERQHSDRVLGQFGMTQSIPGSSRHLSVVHNMNPRNKNEQIWHRAYGPHAGAGDLTPPGGPSNAFQGLCTPRELFGTVSQCQIPSFGTLYSDPLVYQELPLMDFLSTFDVEVSLLWSDAMGVGGSVVQHSSLVFHIGLTFDLNQPHEQGDQSTEIKQLGDLQPC
ncbi:serine/threonine-protein phosphatase 7 long form-like protein [Senna tora]|uniref:Serine/threonine-protein phosphatase 7 long form-like protein n=1 Tax=Senna tora TaxID=362788 RepID=A0A834W6X8_9FABA|nr:serine/threonine-protein phosphatase 7 long form-like protein [Senna tora]